VKLLDGQPEVISRATFSPDGYRLVFGFAGENKGDIVKIWNIQNDEEVYSLPPPKESVSIEIITFNADLNMVALGGTERLPKGSDNATIWLEPLL
jgi:WD40 repeat protein